jgi:hypothetical protein
MKMQAAYRSANDTEDASGQHLLFNQSFNKDVTAATGRQAEWWSTINSGNVIDLDGVAPALAIKPEDNDFEFSSDDDANIFLDYRAFDHHH